MCFSVATAVACLAITNLSAREIAAASIRRDTNIPAQNLGSALACFATGRSLQLVYASQEVDSLHSSGAVGALTASEALTQLLNGTGLTYRYLDEQTITVLPIATGAGSDHTTGTRDSRKGEATANSFWSKFRLASVVAGLVALTPTTPRAQEAAGAAPPSPTLDEVVVTATRREESLQDVPVAVTAVSAEQLAASGISDPRQLMQVVPGLTGARNIGGLQPSIRGVQTFSVAIGDESNVAVYVDGVYQPDHRTNSMDFVNLERVEVLRGPQGTLFGRNATGGLINIITPDPKFAPAGRVSAEYSHYRGADDGAMRFYGTTGLNDKFAIDGALLLRGNDGYIKNLTTGGKEGEARVSEARSKLLFEPSDSAKAVLTVGYGYNNDNASVAPSVLTDAAGRAITVGSAVPGAVAGTEPYTTALSIDPDVFARKYYASLRTQFDLGSVDLETTTGYWRSRSGVHIDNDASSAAVASAWLRYNINALSQEVRLLSTTDGPLKWIAGVFGFHQTGSNETRVYNGRAPFLVMSPTPISIDRPSVETNAVAAFAEATYSVTPDLRFTVGGRESYEERSVDRDFTVVDSSTVSGSNELSGNKFTYRASTQYDLTDRMNVYLSYGTGFKSAVFNIGGTPATAAAMQSLLRPVQPETIAGFELGLKADLTAWLRTNVALFDYDYEDMQLTARDPMSVGYILVNAAESRLRGVEAELWAQLTDALNLRFSGSYLDAKYTRFPGAQTFAPVTTITTAAALQVIEADVSGNRLIRAPEYTVQGGLDWRHTLGRSEVGANLNVFYTAKVYQDFGNDFAIPAHEMINGEIWWSPEGEKLRLALWATNLTDVRTYQQVNYAPRALYVNPEKPRRIGLRVSYDF